MKALELAEYLEGDVTLTERCDEAALMLRKQHEAIKVLRDGLTAPPFDVPMLSDEEIKDAIRHLYQDETALQMSMDITLHEFRAIEQAVHQKAGLK